MEEEKKPINVLEILSLIKEVWVKSIWPCKWIILILAIALAAWSYNKESSRIVIYSGGTTFMLEAESVGKSNLAGGNSMVANFMGSDKSNKNILMALFLSNKMKELTLLSSALVDGEEDLLINHYKRIHGAKLDSSGSYGFDTSFRYGKDPSKDSYLRQIASSLSASGFHAGTSEDGIFYLLFESSNEDFTLAIIENHIKIIGDYYIGKRLEKAQKVLKFSENHRNDVKKKLASTEYSLASLLDRSNGAVMNRALIDRTKLERKVGIYSAMYTSAEQTYQSARINVLKETPYIQIIDDARSPLRRSWNKPVPAAIKMFIIALVASIGVCVGIYFLRVFIKKQKTLLDNSIEV